MKTRQLAAVIAACAGLTLPALAGGPELGAQVPAPAPSVIVVRPVTVKHEKEAKVPHNDAVDKRMQSESRSIAVGPMDLGSQHSITDEGINDAPAPADVPIVASSSRSPYGKGSTGLRPVWIVAQPKADVTVLAPGQEAIGGAGDLVTGNLVRRTARELVVDTAQGEVPIRYDQATRFDGVTRAGQLSMGQPVTAVVDQRGDLQWGLLISSR